MGVWDYLPPPAEFFQEWSNLVYDRILSWHKASWRPTLCTPFVKEEEHKAVFAKSDDKKKGPLSRNSTNYLFFIIIRNLHLWLPVVNNFVNNPWEKPLTSVLIRPLVFRWILAGVQHEWFFCKVLSLRKWHLVWSISWALTLSKISRSFAFLLLEGGWVKCIGGQGVSMVSTDPGEPSSIFSSNIIFSMTVHCFCFSSSFLLLLKQRWITF